MKLLLILLFLCQPAVAAIVPSTRLMTWTPGTTVGVPGGIPAGRTEFVNLRTTNNAAYLCAADGITDDSAKIDAACTACPDNQYVYMPTGTYAVSTTVGVQFNENWTLKGDGMGKTIWKMTGSAGHLEIGSSQFPIPTTTGALTVTSGTTKGSSTLVVADTTTVNVGNYIFLRMATPTWMHTLNGTDSANLTWRMLFKVASKTATDVVLSHPLPIDVTGLTPTIVPWGNGGGSSHVIDGIGIEGVTFDATNGPSAYAIKTNQSYGCWIKDCEVIGAKAKVMRLEMFCAGEVRGCYTHHTLLPNQPNKEGIDFVDGCWNLIEDNICISAGKPSIIIGDGQGGCVGNVIAYNFCVPPAKTTGDADNADISLSHGDGGNMFNLVEGNIANGIQCDGYYGGSSYNTQLRNAWNCRPAGATPLGPIGVMLNHYAVYHNVVGCVIGNPYLTFTAYEADTTGYKTLVRRLGYPNAGSGGFGTGTEGTTIGPTTPPDYSASPTTIANAQARDLNVINTLIWHGNWDVVNAGTQWMADDSLGTGVGFTERTIPDSYYLLAAPSWWGSLPWPAIGPDLFPMNGMIPAQVRAAQLQGMKSRNRRNR